MGYTHNWTVTMPPQNQRGLIADICLDLIERFVPVFEPIRESSGAVLLHHISGQATDLRVGPSPLDDTESCGTGRGFAEVHIAEALWRMLFAVNDAGGSMRLWSDWTCAPLDHATGALMTDAGLALGLLRHRCADLLAGRTLVIKQVPRVWPTLSGSEFVSEASSVRLMLYQDEDPAVTSDALVFGIKADGSPDYGVFHTPASAQFAQLVDQHMEADNRQPVLRGFRYADCVAWLDGRIIVGSRDELLFADHPESVARQVDLMPLVPDAHWLRNEAAARSIRGAL